jgi:Asp-tRNA(Asn)/Glu-tRNA(Gln) amidotransferase A subunit family amidase
MTLCWSLDKLGPMTRSVEDSIHVLRDSGPDDGDISSVPSELDFMRLRRSVAFVSAIFRVDESNWLRRWTVLRWMP